MPDPSPSTQRVLNSNFLQLGRRSGGRPMRTVYPRRLSVNCDTQYVSRHRTHNLVRRATSRATETINLLSTRLRTKTKTTKRRPPSAWRVVTNTTRTLNFFSTASCLVSQQSDASAAVGLGPSLAAVVRTMSDCLVHSLI